MEFPKFPGRRAQPTAYGGARGEQIQDDGDRHGYVDTGNLAWPERIAEARRLWPQANSGDFEKIGKRRYVDRATGAEYLALRGAPLLAVGTPQVLGASCFFVENGQIRVLRRSDWPEEILGPVGYIRAQQVSAASPGPEGVRIW